MLKEAVFEVEMTPSRSSFVFILALIVLVVHGSAFAPMPSSAITSRDLSCNAKKPVATGIGGLNNSFKIGSGSKPKTAPKKIVPAAKKSNGSVKKTKPSGSSSDVKMSEETSWSTILLAFLTPWRNPNSIFLYLLIIVSVLGKMNEQ